MIPRIIHYVWVGRKPKPFAIRRCISSWRRHLSNYEIVEWNESNCDLSANRYLREAYDCKKWAFVSDFLRLQVVHRMGGIYLDSDCYVRGSLDPFLRHSFFSGFESEALPFTAAFGATPNHPLVGRLLREYEDRAFCQPDGTWDQTTNTSTVSSILHSEYGCRLDGTYQELESGAVIYPEDVLCRMSNRSVVVHLMNYSWADMPLRRFHRVLGGSANAALLRMAAPQLYIALDRVARAFSR